MIAAVMPRDRPLVRRDAAAAARRDAPTALRERLRGAGVARDGDPHVRRRRGARIARRASDAGEADRIVVFGSFLTVAAALAAATAGTRHAGMAERIADNADLAVDELKRRARRRLVGAIVLALAAADRPAAAAREGAEAARRRRLGADPAGRRGQVRQPPDRQGGRVEERCRKPTSKATAPRRRRRRSDAGAPAPSRTRRTRQRAARHAMRPSTAAPAAPRRAVAAPAQVDRRRRSQRRAAPAAKPAPKPKPSPRRADARREAPRRRRRGARRRARGRRRQRRLRSRGLRRAARGVRRRQGRERAREQAEEEPAMPPTSSRSRPSRGTLWRVRVGGYATRRSGRRAREAEGRRLQRHRRAGEVTRRRVARANSRARSRR